MKKMEDSMICPGHKRRRKMKDGFKSQAATRKTPGRKGTLNLFFNVSFFNGDIDDI